MLDFPRLALLDDEIKRFNLPVRPRSFRKRARDFGACYVFGRQTWVTAAQLIEIIDSWVRYPPSNTRQPSAKPKPVLISTTLASLPSSSTTRIGQSNANWICLLHFAIARRAVWFKQSPLGSDGSRLRGLPKSP